GPEALEERGDALFQLRADRIPGEAHLFERPLALLDEGVLHGVAKLLGTEIERGELIDRDAELRGEIARGEARRGELLQESLVDLDLHAGLGRLSELLDELLGRGAAAVAEDGRR